jgi:hypothetical protein
LAARAVAINSFVNIQESQVNHQETLMPNQKQSKTDAFLTAEEQVVCQKIAALTGELAGQRAATLLAIDAGSTQAQASEQSGLTAGQVRYLVTAFRKKGLAIFPEDVLSQVETQAGTIEETAAEVTVSAEVPDAGEDVPEVPVKARKEKKPKKPKKKKTKKDKAEKADKKPKKAKKKVKKEKKSKKSKKEKDKKAAKKKSKK